MTEAHTLSHSQRRRHTHRHTQWLLVVLTTGGDRFVARAAEAFEWNKKRRRRLMQYIVDTDCFGQLYGQASEVRLNPYLLTHSKLTSLRTSGYYVTSGCQCQLSSEHCTSVGSFQ